MKRIMGLMLVVTAIAGLLFYTAYDLRADSASDLDYHSNVKEAYAIADASSGVCAEIDGSGYLQVVDAALVVDLAAIEVLITAGNVDLAAMEALLITMDADTGNCATDLAAIEVLLGTIDTDTSTIELAYDVEGGSVSVGGVLLQGDDGTDRQNVAVDTDGNIQVDIITDLALTAAVDSVTNTPLAATGVVVITNDAVVKASAGTLYGVMVSFDGVTAGDTVEIENHATADSGTSLCTFVAQAADQNFAFQPCVGIAYAAGIYCDFTLSGGAATVTAVYE